MNHNEVHVIGGVYGHVKEFLVQTNLAGDQMASLESFNTAISNFNPQVALTDIGPEDIQTLCASCGISEVDMRAAVESVGLCIHNYTNNYDLQTHFASSSPSASHGEFEMRDLDTIYDPKVVDNMYMDPKAAIEAFGATTNNTITDAKVAITVSILRFHRSVIQRLLPTVPTTSNIMTFKVDHLETYDLTKSRDNNSSVREGDHQTPFVDLYRDPSPANIDPKPIVLRTANDTTPNKLIDENIVKIGTELNMFDYSLDAGTYGYNHVDYTDLVGDDVRIKSLYITVGDGSVTEMVPVNTMTESGARLVMSLNNNDSADRSANLTGVTGLKDVTTIMDGTVSTILDGFSADAVIKVSYNVSGSINLRTSNLIVHGIISVELSTVSGNAVISADQTLFDTLTIELAAYEVAANFSEENVRKTTKALRILSKQYGYEIKGSANTVVQYSLNQTRPEVVIDGLAKLQGIGIDDRGINIIMNGISEIKDKITAEAALDIHYSKSIANSYVSGQRIRPYVYQGNIDVTNSVTIKESDRLGDVRSYTEKIMLEVVTRLMNESFYQQELGTGEKVVFNVLTSGFIKDALLTVPHYHDHLRDTSADAVNDGQVEFRRTLPNGVVLNIFTTTFEYMTDRIIMVPVRPNNPRSTLNFACNAVRGSFVAQATPSVDGAIYNQLIASTREMPIVLTPMAAMLTVTGLSAVFEGNGGLGA
jgi:hypothetical protein